MPLDAATTAFLAQLAAAGMKPLHEMTPGEARELSAVLGEMYGAGPDLHTTEDVRIPVEGGDILVRVLTPTADPRGVLVYYHGGGWLIGDVPGHDTLGRVLAQRTGLTTLLVDYRLAPEHRYPAAAQDAWAALLWAQENRSRLAPAGGPLIVCGDSAGGNLSAVVAQRAKAAGPPIDLQVLVYPVTDHDLDTESYLDPANQLLLTRDLMIWFWDHYVPDAARSAEPAASPSRRPTWPGYRRPSSSPPSMTRCATRARRTPAGWPGPACRCGTSASTARCTASSRWSTSCRAARQASTTSWPRSTSTPGPPDP